MPKSAPWSSVEAFVREAKKMDGMQPTTVGSTLLRTPTTIARTTRFGPLRQSPSRSSVRDAKGYTLRKMRLKATDECVVERIIISEESDSVTFTSA